MGYAFTYQGASGGLYDFLLCEAENLKAIPWSGGLYLFASYAPEPLYIGEGDNIYRAFTGTKMWEMAQTHQGANQFYIHLQSDPGIRQSILEDLVTRYQPPMNAAEQA